MNNKKINSNNRYIKIENEIRECFKSFIFEPFTTYKNVLCDEITKKVKSANIFSHFGGKYKTILEIDPLDNYIKIDVVTIDGKWRLMKLEFYP